MKSSENSSLESGPVRRLVRPFENYWNLPPIDAVKCPDCEAWFPLEALIQHLRWQHFYEPEAARYHAEREFEFAEKRRAKEYGIEL